MLLYYQCFYNYLKLVEIIVVDELKFYTRIIVTFLYTNGEILRK